MKGKVLAAVLSASEDFFIVHLRLRLACRRVACRYAYFLFRAMSTVTATATVAPTIGVLPMPRKPIISTWAGTDEEPANWASELSHIPITEPTRLGKI